MKSIILNSFCFFLSLTLAQGQNCKFRKEKDDPFKKNQSKTIVVGVDYNYSQNDKFFFNLTQINCNYNIELKLMYGSKQNFYIQAGTAFTFKLENEELITLYTVGGCNPQFQNLGLKYPGRIPNPALGDSEYYWSTYWYPVVIVSKENMEKLAKSPLIVYKTEAFQAGKPYIEEVRNKFRNDIMEAASCMLSIYCVPSKTDENKDNNYSTGSNGNTANNSIKDGPFSEYDSNKKLVKSGNYKNGKKFGHFLVYKDTVAIEDCNYDENEKLTGKYIQSNADGKIRRISEYKNGKLNGIETTFEYGIKKCETNYVDDKKNGKQTCYSKSGAKIIEYNYLFGVENGKRLEFYPSGKIHFEDMYLNDKKTGKHVEYNENGQKLCEGEYLEEKKEGEWNFYDAKGKIIKKVKYLNGKEVVN
ncbi:MAG: toxin-antitoxin system YwqK family antitoxin [Bacteroidia bacterium]|nr:toxin-antitoxin system YwqK family antitoxin [Bacteroidia bacterium]